jgi:hypothetical protein
MPLQQLVAVTVLAAFGLTTSGCLSHEYRVSRDELVRLSQMPPEARSQRVKVVQKIGARRAPPVTPGISGGQRRPCGRIAAARWVRLGR